MRENYFYFLITLTNQKISVFKYTTLFHNGRHLLFLYLTRFRRVTNLVDPLVASQLLSYNLFSLAIDLLHLFLFYISISISPMPISDC